MMENRVDAYSNRHTISDCFTHTTLSRGSVYAGIYDKNTTFRIVEERHYDISRRLRQPTVKAVCGMLPNLPSHAGGER